MRIKTQLNLLFTIVILALMTTAVSMAITNSAIDKAITTNRQAYEITHDVSLLHRLASELTQNNTTRVEKQWDIVMDKIRLGLKSQQIKSLEITARLKSEEIKANEAFRATVKIFREDGGNKFKTDYRDSQFLSRNHLAVVLSGLVAIANDMTRDSYQLLGKARRRHNIILTFLASISLILVTCWLINFWKAIMLPLQKMLQAIRVVSTGDLQYRVSTANCGGDMRTLVDSFNAMLNRLQMLTVSRKHLFAATEDERSRIGRELHDGVSQTLVGARLKLESMDIDDTILKGKCRAIAGYLAQTQQDIQRIVKDLHPAILDDRRFVDALQWFAQNNSDECKITVDIGLDEKDIPPRLHVPIFRIVQEATRNALCHGKAFHIQIQMNREENAINLFVEDDGQGFDPTTIKTGNGLINMRGRTEAENGELTIDSAPDRGCCIIASFPLG